MRIHIVTLAMTVAASTSLAGCVSTPSKALGDPSNSMKPCSVAPHCVSSKNAIHSPRHVDPFQYEGSLEDARAALLQALRSRNEARIESDTAPLIHATFHTALGFVDDVTFIFRTDAKTIDVKSRSRIGFYDLGVNGRRIESLRTEFSALLATKK